MNRSSIVLLALITASQAASFAQQGNEAKAPDHSSPFLTRLLSFDADKDGFVTTNELPERLAKLAGKHDGDSDGKLNSAELQSLSKDANAIPPAMKSDAAGSDRKETGRARRGAAGGRMQSRGGAMAPEQILRFALTFDKDGDGGLNAKELRAYAHGLVARRAGGRASESPPAEGSPDGQEPGTTKTSEPAKGLSADGRGDGGFGDAP